MTSVLLIGVVVVVLSLGMGLALDRTPRLVEQLRRWPFRDMPGTSGAILGLLFVGTLLGIFLLLGVMAHAFRWL